LETSFLVFFNLRQSKTTLATIFALVSLTIQRDRRPWLMEDDDDVANVAAWVLFAWLFALQAYDCLKHLHDAVWGVPLVLSSLGLIVFAIRTAVKDIKKRGMGDSPPAEDNSGSPPAPADSPCAEGIYGSPVLTVEDTIAALIPAMDNAIAALNRALGAQSTPPMDLEKQYDSVQSKYMALAQAMQQLHGKPSQFAAQPEHTALTVTGVARGNGSGTDNYLFEYPHTQDDHAQQGCCGPVHM